MVGHPDGGVGDLRDMGTRGMEYIKEVELVCGNKRSHIAGEG